MYITRIEVENIRCFDERTIEFNDKQRSILITGDNGDGKTTLLRSIAMGLCDLSSAAALFREIYGKFIRKGKKKGMIKVYLSSPSSKNYFLIQTIFIKLRAFERVEQEYYVSKDKESKLEPINQDSFPWNKIFVSGYGAGLRTLGTATLEEYTAVDSVYPLFRYDEPLQNPELALHRVGLIAKKRAGKNAKKAQFNADKVLYDLLQLLKVVLNLDAKDRVVLTSKGIEVKSYWGQVGIESLGDGYKSTIIWILDLIGRRLQYGRTLNPKMMSGIVLLDEIEQHLHPIWQLGIMRLLRDAFPRIQFIATSHSPLVVSGCRNIPVHNFYHGQHEVHNVHGWLAEDVYRMMGLSSSRSESLKESIHLYQKLQFKSLQGKLTSSERSKLYALKKQLKKLPKNDPVVLMTELENLTKDF